MDLSRFQQKATTYDTLNAQAIFLMFETLDDGGNYEWLINLRAFCAPLETRPLYSSSRDIKEIARCTTFNKDVARTYRAHEYSIPPMMVAMHFFLPWLASSSSARLSRDEKQCKARKSIRRWRIDEWWFRLEVIFSRCEVSWIAIFALMINCWSAHCFE